MLRTRDRDIMEFHSTRKLRGLVIVEYICFLILIMLFSSLLSSTEFQYTGIYLGIIIPGLFLIWTFSCGVTALFLTSCYPQAKFCYICPPLDYLSTFRFHCTFALTGLLGFLGMIGGMAYITSVKNPLLQIKKFYYLFLVGEGVVLFLLLLVLLLSSLWALWRIVSLYGHRREPRYTLPHYLADSESLTNSYGQPKHSIVEMESHELDETL